MIKDEWYKGGEGIGNDGIDDSFCKSFVVIVVIDCELGFVIEG